jgi:chromosome segregation ATPase
MSDRDRQTCDPSVVMSHKEEASAIASASNRRIRELEEELAAAKELARGAAAEAKHNVEHASRLEEALDITTKRAEEAESALTSVAELTCDLERANGNALEVSLESQKRLHALRDAEDAVMRVTAELYDAQQEVKQLRTSRGRWRGLAEDRARQLAAESFKVEQLRQDLDCALHVVIEADLGHAELSCCGCGGCEWVKTWLIDNGHLEADG